MLIEEGVVRQALEARQEENIHVDAVIRIIHADLPVNLADMGSSEENHERVLELLEDEPPSPTFIEVYFGVEDPVFGNRICLCLEFETDDAISEDNKLQMARIGFLDKFWLIGLHTLEDAGFKQLSTMLLDTRTKASQVVNERLREHRERSQPTLVNTGDIL